MVIGRHTRPQGGETTPLTVQEQVETLEHEQAGEAPDATLAARNLKAGYGGDAVIRDVTVDVDAGEVVALLGANGTGKTTPLLGIAGELPLKGRGKSGSRGDLQPPASGGEQQMLTMARALARDPRVLLSDELSLGLAPLIVERLLQTVRAAADRGTAVLLVEQHVREALKYADRAYVMNRGKVVDSGTAEAMLSRIDEVEANYLGSVS